MTHSQGSLSHLQRALRRPAHLGLMLLALCWAGLTLSPQAQGTQPLRLAQSEANSEARISASQAAAIVQKHYGGKVLNIQAKQKSGHMIYRIKILQDNGRIRTVGVDARTGKLTNS